MPYRKTLFVTVMSWLFLFSGLTTYFIVLVDALSRRSSSTEIYDPSPNSRFSFRVFVIRIYGIDLTAKSAVVDMSAELELGSNFFDGTNLSSQLDLTFVGDGNITFSCAHLGQSTYRGTSDKTTWRLNGDGSWFPFDSYSMNFTSLHIGSYDILGSDVILEKWEYGDPSEVGLLRFDIIYEGLDPEVFMNTWSIISQTYGIFIAPETSDNIVFIKWDGLSCTLQRRFSMLMTVQFLLPILACYFLLGSSLLLGREKLNEKLTVYLAMFVFGPTFLFATQQFLPPRSYPSLPEFMMTYLTIATTIFAISAMKQASPVEKNKLDLLAVILSSFILALSYIFTYGLQADFLLVLPLALAGLEAKYLGSKYGSIFLSLVCGIVSLIFWVFQSRVVGMFFANISLRVTLGLLFAGSTAWWLFWGLQWLRATYNDQELFTK